MICDISYITRLYITYRLLYRTMMYRVVDDKTIEQITICINPWNWSDNIIDHGHYTIIPTFGFVKYVIAKEYVWKRIKTPEKKQSRNSRSTLNRLSLQGRHYGRGGVSNYQPRHCLLNRLSGADQRTDQSSTSLAFVRGIHRWPVNSPHKWPVMGKMFPFDDVIMKNLIN